MANLTDKFRKGAPFFQTTLGGSISDSDTSFTLASATGLPTDTAIDFLIDRIDQNGELMDPALREVITGTVSGTTVTTDASRRGLDNTTAQAHTAGAVVEVNFTADTWNDHIDGILVAHNQDGTQAEDSVDTQSIQDEAVTADKIADELTDYSTSEVNTGAKWVDGKDIYKKTVSLGSLPNATTSNVAHGITGMDYLISLSGDAKSGTTTLPLPYASPTSTAIIGLYRDGSNLVVTTGANRSGYTGYATLYYTKTS